MSLQLLAISLRNKNVLTRVVTHYIELGHIGDFDDFLRLFFLYDLGVRELSYVNRILQAMVFV